jgi:3-hydroxyisobutyrate dehydrogenase-like beta-hydroxyacid dehydrogenase
MNIGFIGLGGMGAVMATNLIKAGHRVSVWNRSAAPIAALVELGALHAATPAEVFSNEIIFSILADDVAVRSVIDASALQAASPGTIHVNLATVSIELTREFEQSHRAAQLFYIAAPVFGRPDVAAAGKLNIVAAGPAAALERVQPLLEVLGQKTWPLGEQPERAIAVKLAGNFMIGAAIEAMAESAALVQRYGVAGKDMLDILTNTLFAAPVYKNYGALIAAQQYEPAAFKLRLGLKDVDLALAAGQEVNTPLPLASLLRDNLLDALAHGEGDLDWAALANVAMRRSQQR